MAKINVTALSEEERSLASALFVKAGYKVWMERTQENDGEVKFFLCLEEIE